MDASGSTVDMYATLELDRGTLPTNLKFYTTSDHKSELHKYYSFLETTNQTETLTIYWYWNPYISDEEDNKFINVSNLEAKIRVSAVQISEYAMMKNGASYVPSTHTYNGTEFWSDDYRPYIRMINFSNDLSNLPETCNDTNLCFDVSNGPSQIRKVYAYLVDSGLTAGTNTYDDNGSEILSPLYNLYIVSEAPIFAPSNCYGMFTSFKNLVNINFNNNFNTSKVESMEDMFSWCSSLTSLDLSSFNTSKVRYMGDMFHYCKSLMNLDLSSFNTSNVTKMFGMFDGCSSLTSLDLSSFNTSKATDMSGMFRDCSSLTSLDLSSFNTSKVTAIGMFKGCSSLTSLDLSSFNTSKVTDMSGMFRDCSSLTSLDLSSFNTSKVTNMTGMFSGCSSLTSLDLSNFNTSSVTKYSAYSQESNGMFYNCSKLITTINIMNANVTNYTGMFSGAATDPNAQITVNYIAAASTLVDNMIATKSSNSNVVRGTEL